MLGRAVVMVDLCRTVTADRGRDVAVYAGLSETSVPEALWMAEEAIREGLKRIKALVQAIERERDEGGGANEAD